ncbi:16S rRNA (cytosine967-C5)-methyltransferase [Ruminococcus flavefaciens]|uniref:16S rRNA (cytosine(967)-C(5))-methyltransferase n=1 Tax=Ruminococcus flavefaciens TaxID=1265 RepID=A0A1H6ID41_RUMFL|nr:16S rRNA (cytosine(967)-C(5))-methyltransferase RsmB [Ruminococcus flavefaciens]SEH45743.1 16S rRNA (cytosine967-C5)-methyltransferase [Ruminococcus flavefaciens]
MTDPRYLAVKLLDKTFSGGSYSNLQLDSGLKASDLDDRGKKLCSAVYYGVIERRLTLDHIIGGLSSRPIAKLDSIILNILRCGIYQIMYMDSVPDNAAVNESVALAKKFRKTSASGMVNAVLRNFIRSGKEIKLPKNSAEAMSVKYSAPAELVKSLTDDYGAEKAEEFLANSLEKSVTYLRLNALLCNEKVFYEALGGIKAEKLRECCYTVESGDLTATEAFRKGYFHVQGLASQFCCEALAPTEQDRVLDICAAPGGKTFTMAELMNGKGEIYAFDLHEKRAELIRRGAERLGLTNIKAAAGDATVFDPDLPKFTKILCDVPCSGLGVIGSKPEIKYKNISDFAGLPDIQYKIVCNALNYLEEGGTLVYSTCTVRKAENEEVCERLLREHPELEAVELPEMLGENFGTMATLMPPKFGSGFFIAKFRKK